MSEIKNRFQYARVLLVLLAALAISSNITVAQTKFSTCVKRQIDVNFSQHISDVELTFDGGYVGVAGNMALNISKFSSSGSLQWSTDVSWGAGYYYARKVIQLADSGYAVAGTGGVGYDPANDWEIAFMRLDKNGNLLWTKTFNGVYVPYEFNMGSWIAQTLDGGLIVGAQNAGKGVLIKTDINGTLQWARNYPEVPWIKTGFLNSDTSYTIWGANTNNNGYVAKFNVDKNGNVTGTSKKYDFLTNDLAVKRTRDKGYIVLPEQYGTIPILMKTDSAGNVQWSKKYPLPEQGRRFMDVEQLDYGYVFVGESFGHPNPVDFGCSSAFWAKTDNSGNLIWTREYDTDCWDVPYSVKQTPDKGLAIWTSMYVKGDYYYSDLVKTDSSGNTVCTLYSQTLTPSNFPISPASITITSVAVNGLTDRVNTYSGTAPDLYYPCSSFLSAQFQSDKNAVCAGETVDFSDQSSGLPLNWKWTFAGGSPDSSVSQTPAIIYNTPGTYDVKLVVANANGKDSVIKSGYIIVNSLPVAGVVTGNPDSVCSGTSSQLTVTGNTGAIQWQSSPDGIFYTDVSNATNALYDAPGIFQTTFYRVKTNNTCGTDSSAGEKITVVQNPSAGIIYAVKDTICAGTVAHLTLANDTGNILWQSSLSSGGFTDITGASGNNYNQLVNESTYFRTYASNGICSDTSSSFLLVAVPSPIAAFTNNDSGLEVIFNSAGSIGADNYFWNFGDSTTSIDVNPTHTYAGAGSYHVCLTVNNSTNCNFTICNTVEVINNGIRSNIDAGNFLITPNPVNDKIFIECTQINNFIEKVEVYDVIGKSIMHKEFSSPVSTPVYMDLQELPAGMYYIKITTNKMSGGQKIIKQ